VRRAVAAPAVPFAVPFTIVMVTPSFCNQVLNPARCC
jgi:hypothetical protein